MSPVQTALMTFSIMATLLYLTAGALHILKKLRLSYGLAGLAWCSNLVIFIIHWVVNAYPPFSNIYQILSVLSLVFPVIAALFIRFRKEEIWLAPYFFFAAAIPLIGTLFMKNEVKWTLVPALRSVWFVPHVFSYMISYALAVVAFILSVQYFASKSNRSNIYNAAVSVMRLSLPFMVNGLALGAIWADQVWGNFWQWDIKEVWSLITCLLYLCGLHLGRTKHKHTSVLFFVFGFVALIITFFFVNIMPDAGSMHTYS